MLREIHCDDGAILKVLASTIHGIEHDSSYRSGKDILGPNLHDAWSTALACGEQHPEIEVVGKDYKSIGRGMIEDL